MKSTSAGVGSIKTSEEKRQHELKAGARDERAWRRQYRRVASEVESARRRGPGRGAAVDGEDDAV